MPQKPVEWIYNKEADLTIGETKVSKAAKIALYIVLGVLLVAGILGLIFSANIKDLISNRDIVLPENKITLTVYSEFNPHDYIINRDNLKVFLKGEVDTSTIGTYTVEYIARTTVKEISHTLTVDVVDNIPPTLELSSTLMLLTRGVDNEEFDTKSLIIDYSDNYTEKSKLILDYPKTIDWSKDTQELTYTVTDEAGMSTSIVVNVVINDEI